MSYAIRFDFPEGQTLFAGLHKGAMGWAPTLATAMLWDNEDEAHRWLENGFGASKLYGRVVAVFDGYPVEVAATREP